MDFQVRHKELGVFQGEFLGMAFWHPMSDSPEQGYCRIPTIEHAKQLIDILCDPINAYVPLHRGDFIIEPFDYEESDRLVEEAALLFKDNLYV